jgi:hypothetical protein
MIVHRLLSGIVLASIALVLTPAIPASAHETGAIHVSTKQVAVGGTFGVRGEKLPKSSALKLELRGILDNYPVTTVTTDTAGAFQSQITVPQQVPVGTYTLVVIASDGDVTARADLAVSAAPTAPVTASTAGQPSSMGDMPGMGDMSGEHAIATPMVIAQTTTPVEWGVIWAVIVASFLAGVILLKRAADHGSHYADQVGR